jgi:NAD-dependent dihydropyrimidine dehydrogenase PreA subunit
MSIIRCECDRTLDIDLDDVEDVYKDGEVVTLCPSCTETFINSMKKVPHIHAAGTMVGLHIDECATCGNDLRHPIHKRTLP